MLCEALENTGLAGLPKEYFLCAENYHWEDSPMAREHNVTTNAACLAKIIEISTTPNGVFGTKVMWNYLSRMIEHLQELSAYRGLDACPLLRTLFPNLYFVWMIRRDKVRQAVSWAKAANAGIWAWTREDPPEREQEPAFDFELVDNLVRLIDEGERGWEQFFLECGVEPLKVYYKDLVCAYERTALDVLDYLGVPYPGDLALGERRMKRQSDGLNDKWVQKYRELKGRSSSK